VTGVQTCALPICYRYVVGLRRRIVGALSERRAPDGASGVVRCCMRLRAMRILYLLEDFPIPPDNGVRIKIFNLVTYMGCEHEPAVLSFWGGAGRTHEMDFGETGARVRILEVFPSRRGPALHATRLNRLLRGEPACLARFESLPFRAAVLQALETANYDLVHLDGLGMAPYLPLCGRKPTVLSTTDPVSLAYRQSSEVTAPFRKLYTRFAAWSLERFERALLPLATAVHVVSSLDREYLASAIPEANVESIEHGPTNQVLEYPLLPSCPAPQSLRILFTGRFGGGPGKGLLTFLGDAFPQILKFFPSAELVILARHASASDMRRIMRTRNVKCLTWADDYCAEIARSSVVVIPDLAGTGIKTRVLYAMALGKPTVGSPTAFEGIAAQHGTHCLVCRNRDEFVTRWWPCWGTRDCGGLWGETRGNSSSRDTLRGCWVRGGRHCTGGRSPGSSPAPGPSRHAHGSPRTRPRLCAPGSVVGGHYTQRAVRRANRGAAVARASDSARPSPQRSGNARGDSPR